MNVLSLFDGISCGQLALQRAGIHYDNYYASEIDKYAIQITQKNFPETIQLGDVKNWREWDLPKIDLLLAGSPCQGFSRAGKGLNFDDPHSALFFEFIDILHGVKPKWFLLENVKMKKEWVNIITQYLHGLHPIEIDSALVSAQSRKRLYWTNIPDITQPEDKKLWLIDILLNNSDPKLSLSQKEVDYMYRTTSDGRDHWKFKHHSDMMYQKSSAIVANWYKGVPYNVLIERDWNDNIKNYRKFDPIEAERLQTIPDNYTEGVSNTRRYKTLGNGWTVDVISHILSHLL
jgi:DNA (cytosine-5)-methyltransferase 3A